MIEENILLSLIVPVYKTEKYIKRCIDSLLHQTFKNIEIILIDDGSPDRCGEMCDNYKELDDRIIVIHKQNGGLGSARNAGIKVANGNYIGFVDSDDWIDDKTVEYVVNIINRSCKKPDVIQFEAIETKKSNRLVNNNYKEIIYRGKDILDFLMKKSTKTDAYFSVCTCFYKAELLKTIFFNEGRINEDITWKYKIFEKADTLVDSTRKCYYYFQGTGSITTQGLQKKDYDLYKASFELMELTKKENYGMIKKLGKVKYARTSLSLLCKIAYYGIDDLTIDKDNEIKKLQKELRNNIWLLVFSPIVISRKILSIMFVINYGFTEKIVHIMKKIL